MQVSPALWGLLVPIGFFDRRVSPPHVLLSAMPALPYFSRGAFLLNPDPVGPCAGEPTVLAEALLFCTWLYRAGSELWPLLPRLVAAQMQGRPGPRLGS